MFDSRMSLLSTDLIAAANELEHDPANAAAWNKAQAALAPLRAQEPELAAVIDARDAAALSAIAAQWKSGARALPTEDREVLKRAMTAFRKSLKITRLDSESSIAGGPMSSGRRSAIQGITPPPRYPREVWQELARQGRLIAAKQGIYELPPE
jgi:hypothetical protein